MIKRILSLAACAALIMASCLAAYGCGGKAELDCEAAFARLLNEVKFDTPLTDESELAGLFLELPENAEAKLYTAAEGSEDVLIMLTVPEGGDTAALDRALDTYLAERLYDSERYSPEQVSKLKAPVRYSGGGTVILCVTDDAGTAGKIVEGK